MCLRTVQITESSADGAVVVTKDVAVFDESIVFAFIRFPHEAETPAAPLSGVAI